MATFCIAVLFFVEILSHIARERVVVSLIVFCLPDNPYLKNRTSYREGALIVDSDKEVGNGYPRLN